MTRKTNLTIIVKVIDLDTSNIYGHNLMVGMDKKINNAYNKKSFKFFLLKFFFI